MDKEEFKNINYIKSFIDYLTIKNYSLCTISSYLDDLFVFYEFINKDLICINEDDIRSYLLHLDNIKDASSTVRRKISTFKSFYKYLYKNNIIDKKAYPLNRVSAPKIEKRLPKFVYYNELLDIIEESSKGKNGIRDRLLIELLYATGVRVSELVNIKINDIDFSDNKIRVLGKGNKERFVYFGEYAFDALNEYLDNDLNYGSSYLFANKNKNNLTTRSIRYYIDGIMKKLSIKTRVTPHVLRHTFATDMLNNGCDIKVVQELLGHSSLKATEIYTHVTNERVMSVYRKCFPRRDE